MTAKEKYLLARLKNKTLGLPDRLSWVCHRDKYISDYSLNRKDGANLINFAQILKRAES